MKKNSDGKESVNTVSSSTPATSKLSTEERVNEKTTSLEAQEVIIKNQTDIDIEERYGIDPDTNVVEGAQVRHPNRPADKSNGGRRAGVKSPTAKRNQKPADTVGAHVAISPEEIGHVSKETLTELSSYTGEICVSVYLPTHRPTNGSATSVDAILFKTLLQQCERIREGDDATLLARTLQPAYDLVRNAGFWRSQTGGGLAFFIAENVFKYVNLRAEPETQTLVNNSFLVSPLLPFVQEQDHFYLLVISKKQSKLFRGDRFGLNYLSVPEMPNGIEDVVHLEEKDGQDLIRSGSSGGGGGAVYHGTGSSRPDDKDNIAMYLAEVDSTIRKDVLRDSQVPLLLAGVSYIIPIYKKVTHYNNVWDTALTGNREFDNEAALHAEAMEAMHDYFERSKKQALTDYGNKSATQLTSFILDDIVRAAHYKRIDILFVDKKARLWGSFDEANDRLTVHASQIPGDDNLVDKTVLKTILSGGRVYMLDEHEMPAHRMMAAVMRYD
ncbi:MAG TPA: hypothetical protein VK658_25425 [Chryseolinea sp.]|nr:hypothetical protein [Chryseolinea sp.]